MTLKTKSALSWFGSDSESAAELAAMLNHCQHVTVLFVAGAGIVSRLTARAIVANDLHSLAITFYRVLAGRHGLGAKHDLIERCRMTLSHPDELALAAAEVNSADIVDRAWAMWAICWLGRKGKGGTKGSPGLPSVRRTAVGGTNASRVRSAADDLAAWARQFERCEWEQVCFRELLPKCADDETCGIYADPPWPGVGDKYLHPFTPQDHRDLESLLKRFTKTTVVVRYGESPMIRELYSGWRIIEASSRTQTNAINGEIWITNKGI